MPDLDHGPINQEIISMVLKIDGLAFFDPHLLYEQIVKIKVLKVLFPNNQGATLDKLKVLPMK